MGERASVRVVTGMVVGIAILLGVLIYAGMVAMSNMPAVAQAKTAKAQRLPKALRACKRDKLKSKRRACEATARKLYGAGGLRTPISKKHRAATKGVAIPQRESVSSARAEGGTEEPTGNRGVGSAPCVGPHGHLCGEEPGTITVPEAEEVERAHQASNTPTSTLVAAGRAIFAATCAACHGIKDEGTLAGPALNQASLTRAQSVGGVMEQLMNPVGAGMPNFRNELSISKRKSSAPMSAWTSR